MFGGGLGRWLGLSSGSGRDYGSRGSAAGISFRLQHSRFPLSHSESLQRLRFLVSSGASTCGLCHLVRGRPCRAASGSSILHHRTLHARTAAVGPSLTPRLGWGFRLVVEAGRSFGGSASKLSPLRDSAQLSGVSFPSAHVSNRCSTSAVGSRDFRRHRLRMHPERVSVRTVSIGPSRGASRSEAPARFVFILQSGAAAPRPNSCRRNKRGCSPCGTIAAVHGASTQTSLWGSPSASLPV